MEKKVGEKNKDNKEIQELKKKKGKTEMLYPSGKKGFNQKSQLLP